MWSLLENVVATISSTTITTGYLEVGGFTWSVSPPGWCPLAFSSRISLGSGTLLAINGKDHMFVSVDWILRMDRQCLCLWQYHQLSKMLKYRALHKSYSQLLYCYNILCLCHHQDDIDETATPFPRTKWRSLQINLADHVVADSGLLGVPPSHRHLRDLQSWLGFVKNNTRKSNFSKLVRFR